MVNGRGKSGKKRRNSTNSSKTEKRGASFESDGLQEGPPSVTSLPPAVHGHLRCFLRVSVPRIHWKIPDYPKDAQVRLKWWGEDGGGVLFRPLDDKAYATETRSSKLTSIQYPVCSGPKQFNAYLRDMGPLIFEVVCGPSLKILGHARLDDVAKLSANAPIHGLFDVISSTSPVKKLADLYISLRFESTSAVYSQLLSSVPTVDLDIDSQHRATDTSDADPAPLTPLKPATPITYPRQGSKADDPFVLPAHHTKGVKFAVGSPTRLEYTANHSLTSSPAKVEKPRGSELIDTKDSSEVTSARITADSVLTATHITDVSSDLIGTLLNRGERLREAMVMSTEDESNNKEQPTEHAFWDSDMVDTKRSFKGGKLFTELLASQESYKLLSSKDDSTVTDSIIHHENKAVDLILGEEEVHYMGESPVSSLDGSVISDTGDPLYDESLLKDLFYTTKVQPDSASEETISSDEEQNVTTVHTLEDCVKKGPLENTEKNLSLEAKVKRGSDRLKEVTSSANKEESTGDKTSVVCLETDPPNVSTGASDFSSMLMSEETGGLEHKDIIENLGPEKLTALGRADTARVMVDILMLDGNHWPTGKRSLGTFFIEYHFPTSTSTHNQEVGHAVATEITRIASKKIQEGAVLFNHRSVFPVFFNAAVTDQWLRLALKFSIYHRDTAQRMPSLIGVATLPLKTVLLSGTLSSSASLQIKSHPQSPLSQDCHLSYSDKSAIGPLLSGAQSFQVGDLPAQEFCMHYQMTAHGVKTALAALYSTYDEVKVELVKDGKPLYLKPRFCKKPPLPSTTTAVKKVNDAEIQSVWPPVNLPKKILEQKTEDTVVTSSTGDTLTLYTLLWIPEGKGVLQQDSHGIVTKSNLYLTCRMFWCEEVSKSRVVWGATSPQFGFKQVAPVLLTPTLLQRTCNNFMVVEIWNRVGSPEDVLVGLVKLPLHQLYLSYRDAKITRTILKSKYPVVSVDGWSAVTNPYTSSQHGHIRVLLTMGSLEQTSAILTLKCGGDIPVELESRPGHHLDMERDTEKRNGLNSSPHQDFVEHQFQIEVEDIRGLSIFDSTVWGETDCFVQYHFPAPQRDLNDTDSEAIPSLTVHRTPATLCVPDPVFHDVARHTFILPQDFPVQKHLQAAFTGSWVTMSSVPGSGGIPFELWRRYYYPNIRDQMVAKACLPVAKLCAMVTMQKCSEANIQTFSLPLKVLPGDVVDGLRHERIHDTGLIDISVKYQQIKKKQLLQGSSKHNEGEKYVCVCLQIFRACGLKAAALLHAKCQSSLSYAAEVGVNAYLVLHVPLGSKHEHVTRTVARTFSPEFLYRADMLLPMTSDQGELSLAEQLETSQMKFEIWHQVCKGVSMETSDEMRSRRKQDVLLGVGRVSLSKLLTSRTGINGWYAIYIPSDRIIEDEVTSQYQMADGNIKDIVGGLELSINFSEAENRDAVIHISRGVGWAPLPAVDRDDDWIDEGQFSPNVAKVEFCLNITKAWIPLSELHSFSKGGKEAGKRTLVYARYKFYDRAPICTKLSPITEVEEGIQVCELKHFKGVVLATSASLRWYMKEECLEIQLWFRGTDPNTAKKDRLLGTAYMNMSTLIGSQKDKHKQISGLFPVFRAGASDLFGACVHLQASLSCYLTEAHKSSDEAQHTEGHFLSDELLETDSPSERHAIMSSHEQSSEQCSTEEGPVIEDDTDTFTAHIIIEQALRLPLLSGSKDERLLPNVYVSYQTLPSAPPSFTKTVLASTSPSWGYQKLERIPYKSLKTQGIVFKLWHRSKAPEKGLVTKEPVIEEDMLTTSSSDHFIGFVSFDLAPLAAGMRQLVGWYNVADFSGQCKGQIKLGVAPLTSLSPPCCLPASYEGPVEMMFVENRGKTSSHQSNGFSRYGGQHVFPSHLGEEAPSSQPHIVSHAFSDLSQRNKEVEAASELSDCSSSVLFSQLRQNLKELDALHHDLNTRLARDGCNEANHVQEISTVTHTQTGSLIKGTTTADLEAGTVDCSSTDIGFDNQLGQCAYDLVATTASEQILSPRSGTEEIDLRSPLSLPVMTTACATMTRTTWNSQDIPCGRESGRITMDTTRYDKNTEECVHPEKEVTSSNKKGIIDEQSHITCELNSSTDSEDISETGYVKDKMESGFTELKDSWLSDEDIENMDNFIELGLVKCVAPEGRMDSRKDTEDVANTNENQNQLQDPGEISLKENFHMSGRSRQNSTVQRNAMCSTKLPTCSKFITEASDEKNSFESECDLDTSREIPEKHPLPDVHSNRQTKALQNFFMPTEKLAQSMRALRLGYSGHMDSGLQLRLLTQAHHPPNHQGPTTQETASHEFARRQSGYKARKDKRPPISSLEADRIARIFYSSGAS